MVSDALDVLIKPFEPHSLGADKYQRKAALASAIAKTKGDGLAEVKEKLRGKKLSVTVEFYLWKGTATTSRTRWEKDLDNLVKPVLDVLQEDVDAQGLQPGLGIISDDDFVYEIHAIKRIVELEDEEGLRIRVSALDA